jgi:HTH-type transcriptional regulator/antitoxin HigA
MEWDARQDYVPDLPPSELLAVLMKEQGLTQLQLAEATGISQGVISRLLQGDREMRLEHVRRFAEFFKVSPAVFV